MKKETIKTATTVVAGFGLALLVVGTSPSFQACIYEHQNDAGGGPLQEHVSRLLTFYKIGRGCGGEWLHKHGEAVIALFTVILGVATWLLWRATKALVIGAEDTSKRQLRAYVVTQGNLCEVKNNRFFSHFTIKNTGQTPAHNLRIISNTCVLLHPVSKSFDFSIVDPGGPSASLLGAGQEVASDSSLGPGDTLKEEWDEALSDDGWLKIYTYGTITYYDVFNNRQWTNFCLYFEWKKNEVEATTSEYHNDAS
jgi:hypothetical protein